MFDLKCSRSLENRPWSPRFVAVVKSVSVIIVVSVGVGECEASLLKIDD